MVGGEVSDVEVGRGVMFMTALYPGLRLAFGWGLALVGSNVVSVPTNSQPWAVVTVSQYQLGLGDATALWV